MKKMFVAIIMACATLSSWGQNNADTLCVSTIPKMHCANCEKKIKGNIRFVKGVKRIDTSVPEQKVTIVYDSRKSSYKDFETAFRKIGFEIKPAGK